mmetsp:Transcript_2681/g.4997  ORF Transcript_2681/g.4997 Transcript_2681/m.4997 type:complete len:108 (-) Transcript_2681:4-327(-)
MVTRRIMWCVECRSAVVADKTRPSKNKGHKKRKLQCSNPTPHEKHNACHHGNAHHRTARRAPANTAPQDTTPNATRHKTRHNTCMRGALFDLRAAHAAASQMVPLCC